MTRQKTVPFPNPCDHCVGRCCGGACGSAQCLRWQTWFCGWQSLMLSQLAAAFEKGGAHGLETGGRG